MSAMAGMKGDFRASLGGTEPYAQVMSVALANLTTRPASGAAMRIVGPQGLLRLLLVGSTSALGSTGSVAADVSTGR